MTTDPCVTHIAEKGEIFTLGDLVALVQAALKADFEPKTPVYANVKLSVMIPAPVKTITIGNPNG